MGVAVTPPGLIPVPLYFVNVLNDVAVSHLHGASPLKGFSQALVICL